MITELEKYGLPGIVIGGLAWFILYLIKQHKQERTDWKSTIDKQFDEANKSNRQTTSLLTSIKTILDHRR